MFLFLTGTIAGIVSGLGMGGGTILIIVLTNILGYEQHIAQASNILFFIPTSIMAILVHLKRKDVDKSLICKLAIPSIISAICGSYISGMIQTENLKKIFGTFLLIVGMYEIITIVKNKIKGGKIK